MDEPAALRFSRPFHRKQADAKTSEFRDEMSLPSMSIGADRTRKPVTGGDHDRIAAICGIIGFVGAVAAVLTDLIAMFIVDRYSPISETISALAVGQAAWIQDCGLYAFAIACASCGVGYFRWWQGGYAWPAAGGLLILLGVDVGVIAYFNQYAGTTNVGADIHSNATYVLAAMFLLATLLSGPGLRRIRRSFGRFTVVLGVAWLILAPVFLLVPTGWDGAYERFLGLMLVVWVGFVSWLLMQGELDQARGSKPRCS
ncbi:DUF998 domain-containing protein [Aurantimonas sp. VKM B-3413]|uniref:DUF998 domain-containing protein n=1 Tax=Aurantimonas sp. VKM B-3413 TaxID=2779401 RepID=UPI001E47ABA6|nr:DUF998 domain-containing protein [Aurantimonas sp. VKM B-3413]MCB8835836.1 DUF998 domain-containing protein [Aurantimonas sp. VKM B-3413]